jgi:hypothetical protein
MQVFSPFKIWVEVGIGIGVEKHISYNIYSITSVADADCDPDTNREI